MKYIVLRIIKSFLELKQKPKPCLTTAINPISGEQKTFLLTVSPNKTARDFLRCLLVLSKFTDSYKTHCNLTFFFSRLVFFFFALYLFKIFSCICIFFFSFFVVFAGYSDNLGDWVEGPARFEDRLGIELPQKYKRLHFTVEWSVEI